MQRTELAHSKHESQHATQRSISGQSTASQASSIGLEHSYANDSRFSRLREQSTFSEGDSRHGAQTAEANHQYNAAQQHELNSLRYLYRPAEASPSEAIYPGSISRPESRQTDARGRTSTPQLGATGTDGEKDKKKSSNTTAANEKELRDMLEKNQNRDLASIAKEVQNAERSQRAERAKQLYAMRWLQRCCTQGKDSVPRNRVYTHYAQRCGNDRVDTLNPASFGKLVRIIFPGIQTRRLGQRGESKYHYVNLTLRDEQQPEPTTRPTSNHGYGQLTTTSFDDYDFRSPPKLPDSTAFPSQEALYDTQQSNVSGNPASLGLVYARSTWQEDHSNNTKPRMYPHRLRFASVAERTVADEALTLPSITKFLPANTDPDLAKSLSATYHTHCVQLIDSMRFVREKSFFRLFATFGGSLTVPVSKLFTSPSIAAWIKLCDWHVYHEIVRFVTPLALQVIPQPVWNMIDRVKRELTTHITNNYDHYPNHVFQAKLEPATIFSKLLERLLRVNETAHAAANLFISDEIRNMMWRDWVKTVQPKRIVETELPYCGYDEVASILTKEIRGLLEPLDDSTFPEHDTEFADARFYRKPGMPEPTSEGVVDRWAKFLSAIPGRFPHVHTRTLLHAINAVGSAALRDVTVAQAPSFGSWWITKCWVDEMMLWQAEVGGFLETPVPVASSPTTTQPISVEEPQSAGLGIDFRTIPSFAPLSNGDMDPTGPPTATFRYPNKQLNSKSHFDLHDEHDDSGIGMSIVSTDGVEYGVY